MRKTSFEYHIHGYRYAPESFHIYKGLPGQEKTELPLSDEQRYQMGYLYLTQGIKSAVDYLNELLGYINNAWLEVGLGMVVFMIARVIAIFMVAGWVLMDLHIGDFVTAMQKMHLPKGFTMTLAVIFRYMPTIRIEFRNINNTMKMRDIEFNVKNIFKHPAKTIEYALVPLVLRSIKVADELSASAMTRGLDLERSRTSHRDVRLSSRDYLFAALVTLSLVASTVVNMLLQNGGF